MSDVSSDREKEEKIYGKRQIKMGDGFSIL
jgi:hypothetical protein